MIPEPAFREHRIAFVGVALSDPIKVGVLIGRSAGGVVRPVPAPAGEVEKEFLAEVNGGKRRIAEELHALTDFGRDIAAIDHPVPMLLVVERIFLSPPERAVLDIALGVGGKEAFVGVEIEHRLEAADEGGKVGHPRLRRLRFAGAGRRIARSTMRTNRVKSLSQSIPLHALSISLKHGERAMARSSSSVSSEMPSARSQPIHSAMSLRMRGPSISPARQSLRYLACSLAKRACCFTPL